MDDQKLSQLTQLTTPNALDLFISVDVSDTTMAASGTDKKVLYRTLFPWIDAALIPAVPSVQYVTAPASTATGVTNTYYSVPVLLPSPTTVTGSSGGTAQR